MKKSKTMVSLKKFWKANWVEILAVFTVIVGIVLLKVERSWITTAKNVLAGGLDLLKTLLLQFSLTDLAGGLAILVGIVFVLLRIRYRIQNSEHFRVRACPRCGGTLHRIHRTPMDRVIGFLVLPHSRRFRCDNQDCRWSGLRYGRHHTEAPEQDFPVVPGPTTH